MYCPKCQHKETKVIDSRLSDDGTSVRRRRECLACGYRFTTYETQQIMDLWVIKRDGSKQLYDREKLQRALRMAFGKRKVGTQLVAEIVREIEVSISGAKEVSAQEIGEKILCLLKDRDELAYIRFASVYNVFESVDEFKAYFFDRADDNVDAVDLDAI